MPYFSRLKVGIVWCLLRPICCFDLRFPLNTLPQLFLMLDARFLNSPPATALCGYPIAKMEIKDSSQISTTAPIFLYYNYFRQNIWVNILVHFHFQYIFVDSTTNNIRFNSRPCSRCWCYPSLSPIKEKFHKCPTHLVISVVVECIDIWVLTPVDCRHRSLL